MFRRLLLRLVLPALLCLGLGTGTAHAQDARQKLAFAADELEQKIKTTRWNFNTLQDKKALEADLAEINRIIEAVSLYESTLRCPNFPGSRGSAATDHEVALIANIVHLRGFVNDPSKWHLNNLGDQKKMKEDIAHSEATLAELRVQHCGS